MATEEKKSTGFEDTKATQTTENVVKDQADAQKDTQTHNQETTTLSWVDLASGEAGTTTTTETVDTPQQGEQPSNQGAQAQDLTIVRELAKSFGINPEEVNSIDDLKAKLQGTVNVQTSTTPQPQVADTTQVPYEQDIERYKKMLTLDDEELVKSYLKELGMSDDEVEEYIDRLAMTDMLGLKATEVKAQIKARIKEYQQLAQRAIEQERIRREQELERARQEFLNALNRVEKLGGIPIAQSKEQAEQVRKEIYQYVTSGAFAEEIFSSPENLAQVAMLWKWRDKIFKMIEEAAKNSAKIDVFKSLTHANDIGRSTGLPPTGGSGVDLSKFLEGIK